MWKCGVSVANPVTPNPIPTATTAAHHVTVALLLKILITLTVIIQLIGIQQFKTSVYQNYGAFILCTPNDVTQVKALKTFAYQKAFFLL